MIAAMFPDQRHPAFFRHIARAVATDPEDIRQLLHWQRRLERRGRKPKPPPQEPKTVPMFSELEEAES